jgi:hypothetical protein
MLHHEAGTCVLDDSPVLERSRLAPVEVAALPERPRPAPRFKLRRESEYALDIALDRMIDDVNRQIRAERTSKKARQSP